MSHQRRLLGLLLGVLAGWIGILYAQVVNHEFINFDDPLYINAHTQLGLSWETVIWAFTNVDAVNWHPITWLSHLLDVELFGLWPGGHHLTSVLLHTINAGLLFWLLQHITQQQWPSFWVAVVFAIHPTHVESVAWIAERKDVLSLCFGLLTIMAYIRYVEHKQRVWYGLTFLLLALGLMSKAMLVTWPFVLLLLDYWPLKRVSLVKGQSASIGWLIYEKLPFFLLVAVFSLITLFAQQGALVAVEEYSGLTRLENSVRAIALYLYKTLLPYDLAVFYPYATVRSAQWAALVVTMSLVLISGIALLYAKRAAYFAVGWFWFLGTLVPVIGIVQVGGQFAADRYLYIPQIGLTIAVVWALQEGWQRGKIRSALLFGGTAIVVSALSFGAWRQVGYWRNDVTLFSHAAEVVPNNYLAHTMLGIAWFRQEQWLPAENSLLQALAIGPQHYALTYLAKIAERQQQPQQALAYYQQALETAPAYAVSDRVSILENYAQLLITQQQLPQARLQLQALLQLQPNHPLAPQALAQLNQFLEAQSKKSGSP